AQCLVGTEDMALEDLTENIDAVYERVKAKVTEPSIKSVYLKLTMGKAIKVA
ncbi:50S ribosomal protein L1, partial [Candidatus Parvarchaeota archaeon]|nr:50S ribosomal protein L1 [Candidatus Parvarchaeota archaeon]